MNIAILVLIGAMLAIFFIIIAVEIYEKFKKMNEMIKENHEKFEKIQRKLDIK